MAKRNFNGSQINQSVTIAEQAGAAIDDVRSYTNKDGQRVYTTDIVAEDQEFAESKNAESGNAGGYNTQPAPAPQSGNDGFMPAGDDSELPFV